MPKRIYERVIISVPVYRHDWMRGGFAGYVPEEEDSFS